MLCLQANVAGIIVHQRPFDPQKSSVEAAPLQIGDIKALLLQDLTLEQGRLLHTYVAYLRWEQDTYLSNHVLTMYGKCKAVEDAHSVFSHALNRDVVSWNAMLSIYVQNGFAEEALQLYEDMECSCMHPDSITFINTLQTLTYLEDLSGLEWLHTRILKWGFEANSVVYTALLHSYGKCGAIESAENLFRKFQTYETIPWNAMMGAFLKQNCDRDALDCFYEMLEKGIKADMITFLSAVSACTSLQSLEEGKHVHTMIQQLGFESEVFVGNALITMYGKCQALEESICVFYQMRCWDSASWNAMIGAYNQASDSAGAMDLFNDMQTKEIKPNIITYTSLLSACETMGNAEEVYYMHMHIVSNGLDLRIEVCAELLHVYGRCDACMSASLLFNRMQEHNLLSWNIMVSIHAQQGQIKEVFDLVLQSWDNNIEPDIVTFVSALTVCRSVDALEKGRCLHAYILYLGFDDDSVLGNALVSMYSKCGVLEDACLSFNKMTYRNVVSWNAMMDAHVQLGQGTEVMGIFREMQLEGYEADEGTYVSALCGCASLESLSEGLFIHTKLVENGFMTEPIEGALAIMYGKCGTLEDVELIFSKMNQESVVSWNTFLSVCTLQGYFKKAMMLYLQMLKLAMIPNKVTLVSILNVCANLSALEDLQRVHKSILLQGFERDLLVGTALMSAYGKCGTLDDAREVFDRVEKRDVIAWNALISMYGQQGHGKMAFAVFQEMLSKKVRPNKVTFVNVLSSCSHAGLMEEGQRSFLTMTKDYGIRPTAELYGCMVDLLGRAGQLGTAEDIVAMKNDALPWSSLLGACSIHGDVERGKRAAERIAGVEADESTKYVLLANICSLQVV